MPALSLRKLFLCFSMTTLAAPVACVIVSDDDDSSGETTTAGTGGEDMTADESGGGSTLGDGVTDCTPPGLPEVVCQAGQYCADQTLADCQNGCLSNDNCASDQTCEKADGEDVGTCQNVGPGGPTLEEFCMKLLTCDPTGTMEQCTTVYNGTNETCHQCIIDGNCGDINGGSCDMDCGI